MISPAEQPATPMCALDRRPVCRHARELSGYALFAPLTPDCVDEAPEERHPDHRAARSLSDHIRSQNTCS